MNVRWLHKELADRYGKDRKSAKPCGVIERVQAKIRQRSGEASLKGLARYERPAGQGLSLGLLLPQL